MNSWRIQPIFDNRSQKTLPTAGTGLGATVVQSTRGPKKPIFFSQGETTRILNIFDVPTTKNPELLEAIEYNKSYPLYISSPSNLGKSSAVSFGPEGLAELGDAINTELDNDLSNLSLFSKLIPSLDNTTFSTTLNQSTKMLLSADGLEIINFILTIDGVETITTLTGLEGTFTISGTEITDGLLAIDTGALSITFNTAQDPNTVIEIEYSADLSDQYGVLALRSPCDINYLKAGLSSVTVNEQNAFELALKIKNIKGVFVNTVDSPITFSLDETHENGYGENIYINNVFENSDFFIPITTGGAAYSTFVENLVAYSAFTGGYRGGDFGIAEITEGYAYFESIRNYPIDLFFDATQNEAVSTIYINLRTNFHKTSRFILPVPQMDVTEALAWTMPANNRGISYYYGYFKLRNLYGSIAKLIGIPMGEVAKKHADIMLKAFGGLSPAWFDENGLGGQLTSGRFLEAIYDPSESQLQLLDEARINPIILDSSVGALIVSRRTSVSGSLSDWSFIDYSGAMDYIIRNISTQVLPYQIVKMNDAEHRTIVRTKTESILQPMTVRPVNVVREFLIKCDSENNNDAVLAREEFREDVAVKFTPKSRTIVLTFINTPQGSSVEEMV